MEALADAMTSAEARRIAGQGSGPPEGAVNGHAVTPRLEHTAAARTAAVIVTWEGGATTDRCVASLLGQNRRPDELVIVDNGSGSAERARLRRTYGGRSGIRLVLLDQNRHFAGGLNVGGELAFSGGSERVLCLNNDTVL